MSCGPDIGGWWLAPLFGGATGLIAGLVWGRRAFWTPIVTVVAGLFLGLLLASAADFSAPTAPCNDTGPPFEPDPPHLARDRALLAVGAVAGASLAGLALAIVRLRWRPVWLVVLLGAPAFVAWGVWQDPAIHEGWFIAAQTTFFVAAAGLAMGPRQRLKSGDLVTPAVTEKGRYTDAAQRRLYPVSTFNSWCARPLSAALAPILSPNQVSLLSLLVSIVGLLLVAHGDWRLAVAGALTVHFGLLLDHADGQVARRTGKGSTWGMYLDMVIDRTVEIGLALALLRPATRGWTRAPDLLPEAWAPLGMRAVAALAVAAVGTMILWRFLTAYNDVLYVRAHLLATGRMPHASAQPRGLVRRPLVPWVFNRDWLLLLWVVGVLLVQAQATLWMLLVTTLLMCIERIVVFRSRHGEPEGDANRILGKDYH